VSAGAPAHLDHQGWRQADESDQGSSSERLWQRVPCRLGSGGRISTQQQQQQQQPKRSEAASQASQARLEKLINDNKSLVSKQKELMSNMGLLREQNARLERELAESTLECEKERALSSRLAARDASKPHAERLAELVGACQMADMTQAELSTLRQTAASLTRMIQEEELKRQAYTIEARVRQAVEEALIQERQMAKQQLEEVLTCTICMDEPKNCTFNCGHQSCMECAKELSNCHICRVPLTSRQRTFAS